MNRRHSLLSFLLVAVTCITASAQQPSIAFERVKHLRHGINASEWFSQHPSDYSAARTAKYTDDADLALMAKLGFDSVRLSIDPVPLEADPHNAEGFNPDFLARLDHVVDTVLSHNMAIQIDIHPEGDYKKDIRTSDEAVTRFLNLWQRLATHYATRSPDLTFFEVMNEPELTDRTHWALVQSRAVEVIRKAAPQHTIIVSGANWSSLPDFFALQPLADQNLIYNFHFYDPHTFTHQGATWSTSWFRYTHDIPYPATEDSMPAVLAQLPDAFSRYEAESYFLDHWDAHRIRLMINAAAEWGKANNVPLLCNEFGAFRAHTDKDSRLHWLHDVRTALEADGISWTMWDYRGGFGVVYKQDGYPAKVDQGVVEALGLNAK